MRKTYRYRSYQERYKEAMVNAESAVLSEHGMSLSRGPTLEEQKEEYQRQQTPAGQRSIKAIDDMIEKMNRLTKKRIQSRRLIPLRDERTGEIKRFY